MALRTDESRVVPRFVVGEIQGARVTEPVRAVLDEEESPRGRHLHERPPHGYLRVRVGAKPFDRHRVAVAHVLAECRHSRNADVGGDVAGNDVDPGFLEFPGDVDQELLFGLVLDEHRLAVIAVVLGDAPGVALDDLREGVEDGLLDRVARCEPVCVGAVEKPFVAVEGVVDLFCRDEDLFIVCDVVPPTQCRSLSGP